jgi:hypothetical protein
MTKPGATPLVTISAKESNCKPKGPATLNNRAKKPSKKSKIFQTNKIKAISNSSDVNDRDAATK